MTTRNNAVKAGDTAQTGVETAITELRRFCYDLRKLMTVGCDGRADQIARHQETNPTTPETWVAGMHSECRTPARQ